MTQGILVYAVYKDSKPWGFFNSHSEAEQELNRCIDSDTAQAHTWSLHPATPAEILDELTARAQIRLV
jgi:hypothetical protein